MESGIRITAANGGQQLATSKSIKKSNADIRKPPAKTLTKL